MSNARSPRPDSSITIGIVVTGKWGCCCDPTELRPLRSHHSGPCSVSAALTVSDSKRAFHSAFPHVIPPLYRRLVDELLVELHLLSRQRGFQSDPLFAAGLIQVFGSFARGYRPEQLREPLLAALCSASGSMPPRCGASADAAVGRHRPALCA